MNPIFQHIQENIYISKGQFWVAKNSLSLYGHRKILVAQIWHHEDKIKIYTDILEHMALTDEKYIPLADPELFNKLQNIINRA